jgi:hypothetical protein
MAVLDTGVQPFPSRRSSRSVRYASRLPAAATSSDRVYPWPGRTSKVLAAFPPGAYSAPGREVVGRDVPASAAGVAVRVQSSASNPG